MKKCDYNCLLNGQVDSLRHKASGDHEPIAASAIQHTNKSCLTNPPSMSVHSAPLRCWPHRRIFSIASPALANAVIAAARPSAQEWLLDLNYPTDRR